MTRRLPSTPPTIPGFSFVRVLGTGGFADVFLYEQQMPRRPVAVKVLLAEVVNEHLRRMFRAEANLMARLSSHPAVLTVHAASVASDGRPYLVMEYCSSALAQRYRADPLPVADALEVGIRIGSAVESAHREGVLHRDIKPSNILVTAFGHPVLSDFGIAATRGEAGDDDSVGMSVPWSAPEVLADEDSGSVASEVWSLAATVYSLLAGRSPFEVPGGDNSTFELIQRIARATPAPIGRPDVPASLEQVLRRAMSRRPADRPQSVDELLRELQEVESELDLPQTPIEARMDDWAQATAIDVDDRTALRGPEPGGGTGPAARAVRERRRRLAGWTAGGVVAAAVVAGLAVFLLTPRPAPTDLPRVSDVSATVDGTTVVFTWEDPGVDEDDAYVVTVDGRPSSMQVGTEYRLDAGEQSVVCATVTVTRAGRVGDPSAERCVEVAAEPAP
ncbi:serine/threonine-protein kinase [Agromyces sp. SYSU T00194]|uniref:serine/threonine-protein kinase n=1 Tax=Agromyces chitinivorans TaxID=3158560 RepID=UPI0033981B29